MTMVRAGKYAFDIRDIWEQFLTSFCSLIDLGVVPSQDGGTSIQSIYFWIKSSAKRAFGECLGSKRR